MSPALTSFEWVTLATSVLVCVFEGYRRERMRRARDQWKAIAKQWQRTAETWQRSSDEWERAYTMLNAYRAPQAEIVIRDVTLTYPPEEERPGLFDAARKVPPKTLC